MCAKDVFLEEIDHDKIGYKRENEKGKSRLTITKLKALLH